MEPVQELVLDAVQNAPVVAKRDVVLAAVHAPAVLDVQRAVEAVPQDAPDVMVAVVVAAAAVDVLLHAAVDVLPGAQGVTGAVRVVELDVHLGAALALEAAEWDAPEAAAVVVVVDVLGVQIVVEMDVPIVAVVLLVQVVAVDVLVAVLVAVVVGAWVHVNGHAKMVVIAPVAKAVVAATDVLLHAQVAARVVVLHVQVLAKEDAIVDALQVVRSHVVVAVVHVPVVVRHVVLGAKAGALDVPDVLAVAVVVVVKDALQVVEVIVLAHAVVHVPAVVPDALGAEVLVKVAAVVAVPDAMDVQAVAVVVLDVQVAVVRVAEIVIHTAQEHVPVIVPVVAPPLAVLPVRRLVSQVALLNALAVQNKI